MLPPEHSGRDDVLLVYRRGKDAEEAVNVLDDVQKAIASAAAAAADLRTVHFSVPRKFHSVIRGADGTVLNALIGEDRMLVSMGGRIPVKTVSEPLTEDSIVVRGPGEAVARVVAQIQQMARDAEQDSIENGFVEEIQVRGSYLPHLIGRGGSNLIKLREELGVRFDVGSEESDRSKPVPVRITGRKECVAVAKERLLAQVERLADEVLQIIQVPVEMHGALIGQGGKYVLRLQDKYDGRILFPHQGDSTTLKPNEVSIRGGRKGVAAARALYPELAVSDTLLVHDELQRAFGKVSFKHGGSAAGHNGVKSVQHHLGNDVPRIRIGIDRPLDGNVSAYVLGPMPPDWLETCAHGDVLERLWSTLQTWCLSRT